MRKHNNVFKEEVKNRKEIRAKAFFTSSLKMKLVLIANTDTNTGGRLNRAVGTKQKRLGACTRR